jgi:hypothetical protein
MALWVERTGTRTFMVSSYYSASADAWSPAAEVVGSGVSTFDGLSLIPGPDGTFAYLYQYGTNFRHLGIYSGGTWHAAPVDISVQDNLTLAANDDGFLLGFGYSSVTLYPFQGGAWGDPLSFSIGTVNGSWGGGKLAIEGDGADFQIAYVADQKTVKARVVSGGALGAETLLATAPADTASVHPHFESIHLTRIDTGVVASWLRIEEDGRAALAAVRTAGWSAPTELIATTTTSLDAVVVSNGPEALFVAHPGSDANQARVYTQGAWAAAQTVGSSYAHENYGYTWLKAAGGDAGFAVAWHTSQSGSAYVSQLWNGTWTAPVAVESGFDTRVQLIPTSGGFSVLGWSLAYENLYELHSSGGVFTSRVAVESSADPVVSMAGAANAGVGQAIYVQDNAVHLQRLDNLSAPPLLLPNGGTGSIESVAFARDGAGVGLAVWEQFDGAWEVYGRLHSNGSWSAPFQLDSNAGRALAVAGGQSGFLVATTGSNYLLARTVAADGTLGVQQTVGPGISLDRPGAIAAAYDGTQWLLACNSYVGGTGVDAYVSADPTGFGPVTRLFSVDAPSPLRAVSDGDGFAVGAEDGLQFAVYRAGSWSAASGFGADEREWELTAGPAGYALILGASPFDATALETWPAGASSWTSASLSSPVSSSTSVTVGPTASGFTAFGTGGGASQQLVFDAGAWGPPDASPFGPLTPDSRYVPGAAGALMVSGQMAEFLPPAASTAQATAALSTSSFAEGVCRANGATFDRIWLGADPGSEEQKVRAIVGF